MPRQLRRLIFRKGMCGEADVFGDFVISDLALAPGADFFFCSGDAGAEADPGYDDLAEAGVGDADVLEWLKGQGKGYRSSINAILRREMPAAHRAGMK